MEKHNSVQQDAPVADPIEIDSEAAKPEEQPKIRRITIKTAVRAAGQSHNRYGRTNKI